MHVSFFFFFPDTKLQGKEMGKGSSADPLPQSTEPLSYLGPLGCWPVDVHGLITREVHPALTGCVIPARRVAARPTGCFPNHGTSVVSATKTERVLCQTVLVCAFSD